MLETLPHELKSQIASNLQDAKQSLFNLSLCSKSMLSSALPFVWKIPKLSPLASLASWQRFLDAVAASRLGLTACDYASWVQGVDDLGLFVGGEDGFDSATEESNVCKYAYGTTNISENVSDVILERKDSKLEGVVAKDEVGTEMLNEPIVNEAETVANATSPESSLIDSLAIATLAQSIEHETSSTRPRVRRDHLLKPESIPFLELLPRDSLHYALALLLTHCPNIKSLNLQLPLPPPETPFPLNLNLLPSLVKLEISTRITNQSLISLFAPPMVIPHRLNQIIFTRLEITDEILTSTLISTLNATTLTTLVLPSLPPPSRQSSHFFNTRSSRPRFTSREPAPQITHMNGILPLITTFTNLKVLDISAAITAPASSHTALFQEIDTEREERETSPLLHALASLDGLETLTLALSRVAELTVSELCRVVIPNLRRLVKLTLKATPGTDDYTGDNTVEEEDVMAVPLFWSGIASHKTLMLVGLDFVKGGEGVMRSYYSCGGGDLGMVAEFRMRWEQVHGDSFTLIIQHW
ncbi:hypothetical protein HDU79_000889 [Rhizoclosmatium sp. JEL0117]|nr:hypothetical protein HDU79_000889 [Rhizoclosmatium sp. JEL0117]